MRDFRPLIDTDKGGFDTVVVRSRDKVEGTVDTVKIEGVVRAREIFRFLADVLTSPDNGMIEGCCCHFG